MPASKATIGYGTKLLKGDGADPEVFTDFGVEINSITPPNMTRDSVEATHMESPDQFREFIAGLMDAGEFSTEINYVPKVADNVEAALLAGLQNWQIKFPNGIAWNVSAFVTSYAPSSPLDDKMTASVSWKISGKPSLSDEGA